MAPQEALGLQRVVFRLVLDPAERLGRGQVAGRFVNATEQDRDVFELDARSLLDSRQRNLGQVGVGTSEIEVEFDVKRSSHRKALSPCWGGGSPAVVLRDLKFYFRTVNSFYTFA